MLSPEGRVGLGRRVQFAGIAMSRVNRVGDGAGRIAVSNRRDLDFVLQFQEEVVLGLSRGHHDHAFGSEFSFAFRIGTGDFDVALVDDLLTTEALLARIDAEIAQLDSLTVGEGASTKSHPLLAVRKQYDASIQSARQQLKMTPKSRQVAKHGGARPGAGRPAAGIV